MRNKNLKEIPFVPTILEGPIPVTEDSLPFCSMRLCRRPYDMEDYGYCEEEYFISGTANVYEEDEEGDAAVFQEAIPYKTRLIVRKPVNQKKFSGRVYFDILNATNCYDHEDLWTRIYNWCVENGHGYVGITSKPINVHALKIFDYDRYHTLNWSSGRAANQPTVLRYGSIEGTEEGLFWDMLTQTAERIRHAKDNNLFNGWPVEYLYLTGQSQSGAYINTYIRYFQPYVYGKDGKCLYDGFLNLVGMGLQRNIRQEEVKPLGFRFDKYIHAEIPYIALGSEGDIQLFRGAFLSGGDPNDKVQEKDNMRYYEVAGSPHFDVLCPVIPSDEVILRSERIPHAMAENTSEKIMNDLPLAYYVNGALNKLHAWASEHIDPGANKLIEQDDSQNIKRDGNGNAIGGIRSPFLDVPIASYKGFSDDPSFGMLGETVFFSRETFISLYGTKKGYLSKFEEYTFKQIAEGWITVEDANRMKQWAVEKADQICGE